MINEMVDFRMLYDWYHSSKRPAIRAGAEAVILSRLLARNHKEMPVTRRMTEGLQRFARVPGVARYTFVYFVDESDKKFDECMKAVLRDKSTEGNALYMLVYRRLEYMQRLDTGALGLDPERLKLLKDLIEKESNRRGKKSTPRTKRAPRKGAP